ncbi:retrovirus-related pol polyprotein from transposon TNT 1-94 [Tanacetum coccineum]
MSLTAYVDADHAGCQDSRRSTSGSAQFLGDRLVSWSSKKQRSTAISTTLGLNNMRHVRSYILTKHYQENRVIPEFLLPRLGMKSLTPETLRRLQEGEDE